MVRRLVGSEYLGWDNLSNNSLYSYYPNAIISLDKSRGTERGVFCGENRHFKCNNEAADMAKIIVAHGDSMLCGTQNTKNRTKISIYK